MNEELMKEIEVDFEEAAAALGKIVAKWTPRIKEMQDLNPDETDRLKTFGEYLEKKYGLENLGSFGI